MVTRLCSTEFENMWNTIMNCEEFDPDYRNTHFGVGIGFYYSQIEKNKPYGWNGLREIISDIESRCVVYYYCESDYRGKILYFMVFGENAINEVPKISVYLRQMTRGYSASIDEEKEIIKKHGGGTFEMKDTLAAECPLF